MNSQQPLPFELVFNPNWWHQTAGISFDQAFYMDPATRIRDDVTMRRVLIDHARKRDSLKRGGPRRAIPIHAIDLAAQSDSDDLLVVDDAIQALAREDERAAEIVTLRFYAGLSTDEIAAALQISERTVMREWAFARARLFELLHSDGPPASPHDRP